jgi:hypothetical protein
MNKKTLAVLIAFSGYATGAQANYAEQPHSTSGKYGVGLAFTGLTGISLYSETTPRNFFQAAVGFEERGSYALSADYAFGYRGEIFSWPSVNPYWGLGLTYLQDRRDYWARFSEVDRSSQQYFGARVPLGLNWVIPETPIQLVIEGAPTILFRPAVFVYLQGSFAVRVLF